MNDERIINLEIRFSHQDMMLEELNKTIIQQQTKIERLEKEMLDVKRLLSSEQGVQGSRSLQDDKPPHY